MRVQTGVPCHLVDWDTAFWGVRVARVEGAVMTDERRHAVDEWCREHGIACAYFLAAPDDRETTLVAERGGFFYTDVRVGLRLKIDARPPAVPSSRLRDATHEDLDDIRAIARVSHRITRFYNDPNFSDERCADLYADWITADLNGQADAVLVAEVDGRVAGYLSVLIGEDGVGGLGLLGVASACRGIGLGTELVAESLERLAAGGAGEASIATQGQNIAALRLFGRAGFAIESMQIWFHKWYDR